MRFFAVFAVSQQADFMFSILKSRNSLVELTLLGSISVGSQKHEFAVFPLNLRVIGKAKLGFVQFVTQCVFAHVQGKTKHSDRKRVHLRNMHCWAGFKLVEKTYFFVIFYKPMKPKLGKLILKKLLISSK